MAISNPSPESRDVVWIQRSKANGSYREVHVSGSDLIIYVGSDGIVNADKITDFYTAYPPPASGLSTGSLYPITASRALHSDTSVSSSFASSSFFSVSSSFASASISASYSLSSSYAFSASYSITASTAISASWAPPTPSDTAISAGFASASISASYSLTASYATTASFSISSSYVDVSAFDNLALPFQYKFSTTTTAADPGKGNFRYNNATDTAITEVYFDDETDGGLDISSILTALQSGSYLFIQQKNDSTKASTFRINNAITDNTGWFTVPVSHVASADSGLPGNNQLCVVVAFNYLITGETYPITSSWAINSIGGISSSFASSSMSASYALTSSFAISSSWAPSTLSNFAVSASWASESLALTLPTTMSNSRSAHCVAFGSDGVQTGTIGDSDPVMWFDSASLKIGGYLGAHNDEGAVWGHVNIVGDGGTVAVGELQFHDFATPSFPMAFLNVDSNTHLHGKIFLGTYSGSGNFADLKYVWASNVHGDVGVGTNDPKAKLHVMGHISSSAITSSLFGTASWAVSASWAPGGASLTTGSTYPITASWAISSSFAVSASWAPPTPSDVAISASFASSSISASYALTSSWPWYLIAGPYIHTDYDTDIYSSLVIQPAAGATSDGGLLVLNGAPTKQDWTFQPFENRLVIYRNDLTTIIDIDPDDGNVVRFSSSLVPTASTDPVLDIGTSTNKWNNIYANNLYGTSSWAVSASWATATASDIAISASFASSSISASYALTSSFAVSASWAPPVASQFSTSASYASSSTSASYAPLGKSMVLCAAYTPTATGEDAAEITTPYSPLDGNSAVSWSVKRISLRTKTAETTTSSISIEKSSDLGIFSASLVGSASLYSGSYEVATSGSLPSVVSGDKVRFNVSILGTSTFWNVIIEISNS